MAGFSELIKSFDKTRDYIRDFFVYGFKVRNEYDRKSARTYDNERRRAESWLKDFLHYETTARGKQVAISVDSGRVPENPLYKAYYSKSFTDNDIRLHFLLEDILAESGERGLTVTQLTDRLALDYHAVFERQTVRNKLKEYTEEGIVRTVKRGNTDYFSLSPDRAEDFFNEYEGLDNAVKFFSRAGEFGVVGDSMLKAVGKKNDIFLMKHCYIVHTLEDEVVLKLSHSIEEKRFITVTNFAKSGRTSEFEGIPMRIYVSTQTGRRFLIMYLPLYQNFNSLCLDSIKTVRQGGACDEYDKFREMLDWHEQHCFGVSFGSGGGRTYRVSVTIEADEETEEYIINRLEREKRCGRVERGGKNLYRWTAELLDPNEILQWLKTYTGRIVSIESEDESIADKFRRDIERMGEDEAENESQSLFL
ncbi:MAG: helix-turn-helix domain-containing protein [Oscillospiraceae bacterium]|nr:helix-turn-helix domain-containing protein [Oscillospiraceae bacterium]